MKIMLDTNICIYAIKNNPAEIREELAKYTPGDIGISVITAAELWYGVEKSAAREKNQTALEAFLLPLDIVPFDTDASICYGQIRAYLEKSGMVIGPLDMLIAAQAVCRKILLVTNNMREFKRIPKLECTSWL